jgi:hypothetical protein
MAADMRFLRRTGGKTERGMIRNKPISFHFTLEGKLTNNKMRWNGYVLRMNEERIPKKLLNMKIKGKC